MVERRSAEEGRAATTQAEELAREDASRANSCRGRLVWTRLLTGHIYLDIYLVYFTDSILMFLFLVDAYFALESILRCVH